MRGRLALFLAFILALTLHSRIASANTLDPGVPVTDTWYTVAPGDEKDWNLLIRRMGLTWDDPVRYILQWNPEVRNPYGLQVGQKLRVPSQSWQPIYPSYTNDFSKWVVIATHTTKFAGSPGYRLHNIVHGANTINNWFEDKAHPYVMPRDSLSLNWILGATTAEKGYALGKAIMMVNGVPKDVPAWGGGICQIPTTIFPALLKAGLNVTVRRQHSYYPYWWWGYPEGFGWDAAVGFPGSDLVWRNMYDYPVRLWLTADLAAKTLRADVYAPPELTPYAVTIDGPYLTSAKPWRKTAGLKWITGAASTVVTQLVDVGGSVWKRSFWSSYKAAPSY